MPDSVTGNVKLVKPEISGSPNTWGNKLNEDMDKLDDYASLNRVALQSALQTGASTTPLTDIDSTDPVSLADDKFRIAAKPLYYADAVVIDPSFPHTLVTQLFVKKLIDIVLPIGTVMLWGLPSAIPAGWAVCNGTGVINNQGVLVTPPDLRGRFILGTDPAGGPGAAYPPRATGGTAWDFAHTHTGTVGGTALVAAHIPPHTHTTNAPGTSELVLARATSGATIEVSGGAANNYTGAQITSEATTGLLGQAHNHTVTIDGNTEPVPFIAALYIMKIDEWGFVPPP